MPEASWSTSPFDRHRGSKYQGSNDKNEKDTFDGHLLKTER